MSLINIQSNNISKFLKPYDAKNGEYNVNSHFSMYCKSGCWLIPSDKYPEFLKNINNEIDINPNREMHYMEKPNNQYNMVKIDVDLRFKTTEKEIKTNILERHYDEEFIELIVNIISQNIRDIIEIKENYNIYVQEKLEPRFYNDEKKIKKDGIHILIPEIVMSNKALLILRDKLIKNDKLKELFKSIGNTNEIHDVIDKRIINTNSWYIYGCGKPEDHGKYYTVSKVYKVMKKNDGYIVKKTQSNKTLKDFITMFSNFGKEENSNYIIDLDEYDDESLNKLQYGNKDRENMLRNFANNQHNQVNIKKTCSLNAIEIKAFLNCLKKERADDYMDWWSIGLCLYNMDIRNFNVWSHWSSQSDKYDINTCEKMWYEEYPKSAKYNLGFTKLREMSKQDNPEEYKKIFGIKKRAFFDEWIHAHTTDTHMGKSLSINTLAEYISIYIRDYASFDIACAVPGTSSIWYKYEKHKWSIDMAGNKIYMLMTDELFKELRIVNEDLKNIVFKNIQDEMKESKINSLKLNDSDNEDEDEDDEFNAYEAKIIDNRKEKNLEYEKMKYLNKKHNKESLEKCGLIMQFISSPPNKKKIIEDLSHKSYNEEFYKNLDENHNVFVCNNGVLDTESCIFRNGDSHDMMTISSDINFPKNVYTIEAQEILNDIQNWLDRIFPEEDVQHYVLNSFACKLSGKLFGEKFHIFTGSGANGKSQFFKLIKKVFDKYYDTFDNSLLNTPKGNPNGPSPAIAKLKGVRIAVTTEPKSGQPFESDKVKELVSGDELTGRHLNKDPISFIPQYMMILMCNDIPRNESTDDGFWRKVFVVPCKAKFISKEDDMYKLNDPVKFQYHFIAEHQEHLYDSWAPYFLYMLFERFKVLKQNNFKFPVPEQVKMAIKEYQDEASTYSDYFRTRIEEAPGYKLSSNELYADFQLYVGRDFKTQKAFFLKQIERYMGKPKGRNKEFINFKIHGTSGNLIDDDNEE